VELTPAFGHDPAVYTHPESCSLSDMPDRAVFPRDAYATARIKPCADIRGPKPDDNCIPIACGLDPLQFPWSFPWFVNLSGSRPRRLHHFSGPVKSQESPGRVGGLPTKNYYLESPKFSGLLMVRLVGNVSCRDTYPEAFACTPINRTIRG
jgi:hypothetical protein